MKVGWNESTISKSLGHDSTTTGRRVLTIRWCLVEVIRNADIVLERGFGDVIYSVVQCAHAYAGDRVGRVGANGTNVCTRCSRRGNSESAI